MEKCVLRNSLIIQIQQELVKYQYQIHRETQITHQIYRRHISMGQIPLSDICNPQGSTTTDNGFLECYYAGFNISMCLIQVTSMLLKV